MPIGIIIADTGGTKADGALRDIKIDDLSCADALRRHTWNSNPAGLLRQWPEDLVEFD